MPDIETKKPRRQLKNLPPDRFQPKVLIFWFILFGAVAVLLWWSPGISMSPAQLTIYEVVTKAEAQDVKGGMIQPDPSVGTDWVLITGELNDPTLKNERGMKTNAFRASGRLTDSNMERLQKTNKFVERPTTTLLTQIAAQVIPILIIMGVLYFLFVRQLRQAGRGALNFGKSRAKLLTRDRDKVTFGDVAGCDEAKEEGSEVVEFLKDPKKFTKMGGRIPKGILMVGAPGTGKPLLAKAVAGEADVPFFSISGSDFVEMFVGVGASRVRDLFKQAKDNSPCIIFLDEIDAVGRRRGSGFSSGGHDEREQTLTAILVEMDGFDTNDQLIVVASTNRVDVLDPALTRPGRFDRQIAVPLPDVKGRLEILKVHSRKVKLGPNVDMQRLARATPGFSGADLAAIINESALGATLANKEYIEQDDLEEARDKVRFGRANKSRVMDEKEKLATAYHEAGHAVVQCLLRPDSDPIHKVTIIPRGRALGSTMTLPEKDRYSYSKRWCTAFIKMTFGGRIAEEMF